MGRRFIPDILELSEAIDIARTLGCKIEQTSGSDEIRVAHPLIGRSVKMSQSSRTVSQAVVSLLREVASLGLQAGTRPK